MRATFDSVIVYSGAQWDLLAKFQEVFVIFYNSFDIQWDTDY